MKKLFILAIAVFSVSAFADGSKLTLSRHMSITSAVSTPVNTASESTSNATTGASTATTGQSQSQITFAPVTTNQASDLKAQGADAAAISAAAAIEIARIQSDTGKRDLSADQRAALDREAAIEIARIQSTATIKNTPSVNGPPLVSSNDTCMGSASGSLNVPGLGIGLGKTYTDDNCVMLKNSREMWNMGMKGAAMALMCTDAANREALELTGFECPQTTRDRKAASSKQVTKTTPVAGYSGNDPIVLARLNASK